MIALSPEYRKITAASVPVVDKIDYNLLLEYGIINPAMMRHGSFELTPEASNRRGERTAPYPFDVGVKSVVTTARNPFRSKFASFDQDMLRLRCTSECTPERCFGSDESNPCNKDLIFYSGDNRRFGQGYVSNYTCGSNRRFGVNENLLLNENPKLAFNFNTNQGLSMYGLTMNFDRVSNTFPTKLRVSTNLNGTEQGCITIEEHSGLNLEIIPNENDPNESDIFKNFNSITIEFLEMNRANIRVRMSKLLFGIMTEFDNEILKDTFVCEFDVDARGCRLPIQKLSFTLHDPENEFDIENPRGKHAYLTEMQPITATMLATYRRNGTMQTSEIPVCDMVLSGNVESGRGSVSFNGISRLQSANRAIDIITTEPNLSLRPLSLGTSLHNALTRVLRQMDLPTIDGGQNRWQLHRSLNNINIRLDLVELEGKPLNECARMIAQAGKCVIFEDAYGVIHVRPRDHSHLEDASDIISLIPDHLNPNVTPDEESGRDLSMLATQGMPLNEALNRVFRQMDLPLLGGEVRWRIPQNLNVNVRQNLSGLTLRTAAERLAALENHVVYEDGAGIIHVVPRDEEPEGSTPRYNFDLMFDVPRLNKFPPLNKVVVEWNDEERPSTVHGNLDGEIETIKSEIIDGMTRQADVQNLANNIASEMSLRNEYSTSIRGGIELEPFDNVSVETKFLRDKTILSLEREIAKLQDELDEGSLENVELLRIQAEIIRKKAEIVRIKNGQHAYISKRALRFNGALNSDIKFFMEPTKGGEE